MAKKVLKCGNSKGAWHDPKKRDFPDVDISVVALCTHPDEDGPVIKRMYLSCGRGWQNAETDRLSRFRVIGWMTDREALSLLGRRPASTAFPPET